MHLSPSKFLAFSPLKLERGSKRNLLISRCLTISDSSCEKQDSIRDFHTVFAQKQI